MALYWIVWSGPRSGRPSSQVTPRKTSTSFASEVKAESRAGTVPTSGHQSATRQLISNLYLLGVIFLILLGGGVWSWVADRGRDHGSPTGPA